MATTNQGDYVPEEGTPESEIVMVEYVRTYINIHGALPSYQQMVKEAKARDVAMDLYEAMRIWKIAADSLGYVPPSPNDEYPRSGTGYELRKIGGWGVFVAIGIRIILILMSPGISSMILGDVLVGVALCTWTLGVYMTPTTKLHRVVATGITLSSILGLIYILVFLA